MQEPQWTPAFNGVVTQEIWNCGWSRPATQRVWTDGKPAPVWACARLGEERRVLRHECERCPHWIHAYEDALDGVLHPTTRDVIERQCAHVRQSHNRVHALLLAV